MLNYRESCIVFRNGIFHLIKKVAFVVFSFTWIILTREFRRNKQKAVVFGILNPFVAITLCIPFYTMHHK